MTLEQLQTRLIGSIICDGVLLLTKNQLSDQLLQAALAEHLPHIELGERAGKFTVPARAQQEP